MRSEVDRRTCPPPASSIWEAGHYYESKGPTILTSLGWNILAQTMPVDADTMLFVDDIHPIIDVHEQERALPVVPFDPSPNPSFVVHESEVLEEAHTALEMLKGLPKRRRARSTWTPPRWSCSGFSLTNPEREPLCLLYDLGLVLRKYNLGYRTGVNILPEFYEPQQRPLMQIARKLVPDFTLSVILFREDGSFRTIRHAD